MKLVKHSSTDFCESRTLSVMKSLPGGLLELLSMVSVTREGPQVFFGGFSYRKLFVKYLRVLGINRCRLNCYRGGAFSLCRKSSKASRQSLQNQCLSGLQSTTLFLCSFWQLSAVEIWRIVFQATSQWRCIIRVKHTVTPRRCVIWVSVCHALLAGKKRALRETQAFQVAIIIVTAERCPNTPICFDILPVCTKCYTAVVCLIANSSLLVLFRSISQIQQSTFIKWQQSLPSVEKEREMIESLQGEI